MNRHTFWKTAPLTSIVPSGWIREFLLRQRDGLTGHLEVAGYPFNTAGWTSDHLPLGDRGGSGWWPYEQYAYWVDGMIRCGLLLDDDFLKAKARQQLDHVLAHPDPDGYLGPEAMKTLQGPHGSERWPHAVFFRAIQADQEERPSKQTRDRLIRHYLSDTAPHGANRNVCNIETMAWLYEQTGDRRMRDLAEQWFLEFQQLEKKDGATLANMKRNRRIGDHGPRHMELFKLGAIMYRITGRKSYLEATLNAHRKLKRDHVLIDGVPSSTEHLRGVYSTAGHETCVISDYLWSLGHLLAVTRDATMADEMERICFNALPGAVTPDFRALQYFSGPNQVVAGPQTNHHPHGIGCAHVSFRPNPATECCPGNVHRAMPAFAGRIWFEGPDGGVVAALYAPSRYRTGTGRNRLEITQETTYPFSDRIVFRFACRAPRTMPFTFRVPGWCRRAEVQVNGRTLRRIWKPGTFATIRRTFADGDTVTVNLPRRLEVVRGPERGVGVVWGPLVLALRIKEHREVVADARSHEDFPAWTMEPASPWNMALVLERGRLPDRARLEVRDPGNAWWDGADAPVVVRTEARRVPGWRLIRRKKLVRKWGDKRRVIEGDLQFMPPLPEVARLAGLTKCKAVDVELVPYGATRLRISWFPVAG